MSTPFFDDKRVKFNEEASDLLAECGRTIVELLPQLTDLPSDVEQAGTNLLSEINKFSELVTKAQKARQHINAETTQKDEVSAESKPAAVIQDFKF